MSHRYDLLLTGGNVIDPAQGLSGRMDVAFIDGKIASISENISSETAKDVVAVNDKLVMPGLIDLHGHFAHKITPFRADPDTTCLPIGVTTAVDTGSTGWINFPGFRAYVMERVDTRLYAFLHLSSLGVTTVLTLGIPDTEDFRLAREEEAVQCIEENRDLILGIKVRLSPHGTTAANAVPSMEMARRVAEKTNTKIMVHVMDSPLPMKEVFDYLRPGDVVTHAFHGTEHNITTDGIRVRDEAWEAREKGVIFDTGCFMRHFSLPLCRAAVEQGFDPDTISTDIVGPRPGTTCYNLLEVMSIFLELGMEVDEIVRATTINPSKVIGDEGLGSLVIGSVGDVAVLDIVAGDFYYEDQLGDSIRANKRFEHVVTVKDGAIWNPTVG